MSTLLPAALVGLVSGTLAAVAVVAIGAPTNTSGPVGTPTHYAASDASGDQVAALRNEHGRLRDEFELRQSGVEQRLDEIIARLSRVDIAAGQPVEVDRVAASAVTAELGAGGLAITADPQFETAVAAAITRIEDRQRQEQADARRQRELDQIEERLSGMRTTLGLDGYQETQMRTIMIDGLDKANTMRDQMRDNTLSRDDVRNTFTGMRDSMNEAVAGVLTASQYEQFQAEFANRMGGFGGPGGFGNRGGGGGGPGGGGSGGGGQGSGN